MARHRRKLSFGLATISMIALAHAVAPPEVATTDVFVAARDLPSGVALRDDDLERRSLQNSALPPNAVTDVTGLINHILTAGIQTGEVFTRTRVLSRNGAADSGEAGLLSTPVRVADTGAVALLEPGDHVDVLATTSGLDVANASPAPATLVAIDATVVSIPQTRTDPNRGPFGSTGSAAVSSQSGALIVLATTLTTARALAAAGARGQLSIVVRGR